jgi:hypothetical protein
LGISQKPNPKAACSRKSVEIGPPAPGVFEGSPQVAGITDAYLIPHWVVKLNLAAVKCSIITTINLAVLITILNEAEVKYTKPTVLKDRCIN